MTRGWGISVVLALAVAVPAWSEPPAVTLLAPRGRTSNAVPAYSWSPVEGATEYLLWLNGPSGNVFSQWYQAEDVCSNTVCLAEPAIVLGEDSYSWWVEASGLDFPSLWSAKRDFRVGPAQDPPRAAKLGSPSGRIEGTSPSFTWSPVLGTTEYHLRVSDPSGVVFDQWFEAEVLCDSEACTVSPEIALSTGVYAWWVQGQNAIGLGRWSGQKLFFVGAATDDATDLSEEPSLGAEASGKAGPRASQSNPN